MSEAHDLEAGLEQILRQIRGCRLCRDAPSGQPLPHEPRPVLRVSATARLAVCGQAPGTRVHASGIPFTDPSGERLRTWMGVTAEEFYDTARVAIIPMGFCFPGQDEKGADLPPRRECAPRWRAQVFAELRALRLVLLVGQYAHRWHLDQSGPQRREGLTGVVRDWRAILAASDRPRLFPLPHPSWRNNAWLKANPWFEAELLPELRREVRLALGARTGGPRPTKPDQAATRSA
jgi:uracil-DNA glycosylase